MQEQLSPHNPWHGTETEATSPTAPVDRLQLAQRLAFGVALTLVLVYVCSPWMG